MIERGVVDGQPAVLSYVNDGMEPVDDKQDATLIVASLEDGRKMFLKVPPTKPIQVVFGGRGEPFPVVFGLAKYSEDQARDDRGRWTHSLESLFAQGTGIARADMPQVPNRLKPAFTDEIKRDGVSVENQTVAARSLKPTQSTFNPDDIERVREALKNDPAIRDNPLVVSSDGRVLDGHHRWAVAAQEGADVKTVRIGLPIDQLLERARDFNRRYGVEARKLLVKFDEGQPRDDHGRWDGAEKLLVKFSPDQPRDDRGRWSSVGGGGEDKIAGYPRAEVERRMAEAEAAFKSIPPTDQINTPERDAMRQRIASEYYDKATADGAKNHQATMVLGLPGAGKSTFIDSLTAKGAINIDNDKIKAMIPEYQGGVGANVTHEEASGIARGLRNKAIGEGYDLVWERINSPDKIVADVRSLKAAGYSVDLKFVDVSHETAINSAISRFMGPSGRYVSPLVIQGYGDSPRESYIAAKRTGLIRSAETYKREPGRPLTQIE